jgi:lycopene beta-cyclase
VPLDALEARLHRRLAHHGVAVEEVHHVERCWFPMNTPLPTLPQPVVGFGGAASMVHPATGYQVGAALKLAPALAQSIAQSLGRGDATVAEAAQAGWQAVWPPDRLRRYRLYLFGLQNVMRFNEAQLHDFFTTFFHLPRERWAGYLSNTLSTAELMTTMLRIFGRAPHPVQRSLTTSILPNRQLLWHTLRGR